MKSRSIYIHSSEMSNAFQLPRGFDVIPFTGWDELKTKIAKNYPDYILIWSDKKQQQLLHVLQQLKTTFKNLPIMVIGKFHPNQEAYNVIRIGVVEVIDYMENIDSQHLKYSIDEIQEIVVKKKKNEEEQKNSRSHVKWMMLILMLTLLNILIAVNYLK